MVVSKEDVLACPKCNGKMKQEEDVLDTWFSSALWPFSTLGWPEKTEDLEYFYPTSVLVTGYDIIFFWVARMIFSGMEQMNEVPFKYVFIHGLVRDELGRKMSKSLGNGIDPLKIIDEYGADALRFTLATGNSPGNDMRFSIKKVEASRNFANKIWNASRFTLMNLDIDSIEIPENLEIEDKWVLSKYNDLVKEVTDNLDKFELGVAVSKLYDFIWDILCDWYIEMIKMRLYAKEESGRVAQNVLSYVLSGSLKLLHPFMPFITEEIFMALPTNEESIMISKWPEYVPKLSFKDDEKKVEMIIGAIKALRNLRAEMNVPMSKKAKMFIITDDVDTFTKGAGFFTKLGGASEVVVTTDKDLTVENAVSLVVEGAQILMPLGELVDLKKERERLEKEKEHILSEIKRVDSRLSNEGFVNKAPQKLIDEEKEKKLKFEEMLRQIEDKLK